MKLGSRTSVLVDIGNSSISWVATCDGEFRADIRSVSTKEYAVFFEDIQTFSECKFVVSSVVPRLNHYFDSYRTIFVDHTSISGISLNFPQPEQVGADLLVTALAAFRLVKGAALIVDSGTALTFSFVDQQGVYQGGQIFPGMGIASQSLNDYTAQVPVVWVKKVDFLVGNSTEKAVQSGLYHGYLSLIQGVIGYYREMYPDIQVLGTGAGLSLFQEDIGFDRFDPYLIFDGLYYLANQWDD